MKPQVSLFAIGKSCKADWEKMQGDDKNRFCEHCQKYVHNLSAMNNRERKAFATNTKQMCIAYFQRADGQIANLSFLTLLRRWFPPLRLIGACNSIACYFDWLHWHSCSKKCYA